MPSPEFSEFQFAYSVTKELEAQLFGSPHIGVPWFPTQNREGDLGYDAAFSDGVTPLFLQYKRSKRLDDSRARDEEWDVYQDTYYRFGIRTAKPGNEDEQHELLVDLSDRCPHTYYVAPEFVDMADYAQYAQNWTVTDHSAFISCVGAPTPNDREDHSICHRPRDHHALMFSEQPKEQPLDLIRGTESLVSRVQDDVPTYGSLEGMRGEFRELRSIISEGLERPISPQEYSHEDPARWVELQQQFFLQTVGASLFFSPHRMEL